MKKLLPLLLLGALWVSVQAVAQEQKPEAAAKIETPSQKASYAIGYLTSQAWKEEGSEFELEAVIAGIRAGLADGKEPALAEPEMRAALKAFAAETRMKRQQRAAALGEQNKKAGQAFLAANKSKAGVKVTASGLQYKVLREGKGPKPTPEDHVSVHYRGTQIDGTEFDSSYTRGEPDSFPVASVIKGWTEALQLMSVGSKFEFFVPSELAYGATPRPGGPIGPHATLIFEVELISVEKK